MEGKDRDGDLRLTTDSDMSQISFECKSSSLC